MVDSLRDLPQRSQRERDCVRALQTRVEALPFAARTPGVTVPNTHLVSRVTPDVNFFRQPIPAARETIWLFETEEDRDRFLDIYPGDTLN